MKELLKKYAKRYFIDAMGAMAFGLFASLLIGTIFKALGMIPVPGFAILTEIGNAGQMVAGPAMAVAIAYALKAHPLVMYTCAFVGYLANSYGKAGGPLAVLFIVIAASEIGMLVSKKTKVDILVTPFVTLLVGGLLSYWCAPWIGELAGLVSKLIAFAMTQQPFLMGLIVSVIIGIALTLPISSAAICAALGLSALSGAAIADPSQAQGLAMAGGAAVAGCCAQMVGFAVMSFKENKWGGLVSQGLGTSMLQMPNIIKNPRIWIPATLTSAITGPLATCVFHMQMYSEPVNSGMGTCGLLGPIGIIIGWFTEEYQTNVGAVGVWDWVGLILICFVLPAGLTLLFSELLYKIKWIKPGDLKLPE